NCKSVTWDTDAAGVENAATSKGYSPREPCVNQSTVSKRPSILQRFQWFPCSRFHGRCAGSQAFFEGSPHRLSQTCILLSEISQPLQGESLHDGAAIFQVTPQGCRGAISLWPA